MTLVRRPLGAACLAILAALTVAGVASAHAQLVASSPAAGDVLASAPTELRLTFSEPLESGFTSADVIDAQGIALVERAGVIDPADANTLVVGLPSLGDGVYTVRWRSLSGADAHPAEGFFTFGVGDVELGATLSGQDRSAANPADALGLAGKWIGYLGMLLGVGIPLIAVAVLRDVRLRPGVGMVLGGLLATGGLVLLALALRTPLSSNESLVAYLLESRGGQLAVARSVVLVAGGAVAMGLSRRGRLDASLRVAGAAALLGIAIHVATGHAAALGSPVPVLVQVVHLVGAGTWLGGVAMLAMLAARPRWLASGPPPALRVLIPRFSALALAAIALVALTGLAAEWSQLGGLPGIGEPYGRALILKLLIVAAALLVGLVNHLDAGRDRRWLGGLRPRLAAETTLALGVLAASALLSTTPPTPRSVALEPRPSAFGSVNRAIALSVSPGRPGVNQLAVDIQGSIGSLSLDLALSHIETGEETTITLAGETSADEPLDHAAHTAPSPSGGIARYVVGAVVLPAESHWEASVVIGDGTGNELIRQRFTFAMSAEGVTDGAQASLANGSLIAGALLLLGGLLGVGLGIGGFTLPRCEATASRVALLGGGALAAVTGLALGIGQLVGSG